MSEPRAEELPVPTPEELQQVIAELRAMALGMNEIADHLDPSSAPSGAPRVRTR